MDTEDSLRKTTYSQVGELGEGTYASVLMVNDEEGYCFAMKKFESDYDQDVMKDLSRNLREGEISIDEIREFFHHGEDEFIHIPGMETGALREVSILRCFSNLKESDSNYEHPNIITLHDICWHDRDLAMVMPKMYDSLYNILEDEESSLTYDQKIKISHDMLSAVDFLHTNNIIHRDVKTDNILLDEEMNAKLCDFSLAKFFDEKMEETGVTHTPEVGTSTYRAPEQIWDKTYSFSADRWSCGVVILEMFYGLIEGKEKSAYRNIVKIRDKLGSEPSSKLIKSLLKKEPENRLSCFDALHLQVFDNFTYTKPNKIISKQLFPKKSEPKTKKHKVNAATRRLRLKKSTTSHKVKVLNEFEKYAKKFDFSNPMTVFAAEVYHQKTKEKIVYCILLASKMYEYYEVDLIDDLFNHVENFDLDDYLDSEKKILIAMDYCLFI